MALKTCVTLCLLGAAVAAPQFGGSRSVVQVSSSSQQEIVGNVVSSITPSIVKAVEEALAAQAAAQAAAEAEAAAAAAAAEAAARRQAEAARLAAQQANKKPAVEYPATNPEYNFEYKVAAEADQTYITQQESRSGDDLTGTYSFVDPRGALVTVNYEAGPMGYSETRDEQLGF